MMQYDIQAGRNRFKAFDLDGNNLALDFVNTVEYRGTEEEIEWIGSYGDCLLWAERTSILTDGQTESLLEGIAEDVAARYLGTVLECRNVLHRCFLHVIERTSDVPELDDFNVLYRSVTRKLMVSSGSMGCYWTYPELGSNPIGFLQPVLQAAADLLVSGNRERLKRCSDPTCGWLYYDVSKNNSRRWCCMKTCGNRAKARRFHQAHER